MNTTELKEKLQDKYSKLVLIRRFDHFTNNGEGIERVILFNKELNMDSSYLLRGYTGVKFNKQGYCSMTSGTLDHLSYHLPELTQTRI